MKARPVALLSWTLTALILVMFVAYLGLAVSRPDRVPPGIPDFDVEYVFSNFPFVMFVCVGGLIAARRPQNPTGWLFLAIGFFFLFPLFGTDYTLRALHTTPGSLPGAGLVSWGVTWTWFAGIGTIVLAILLFPNGKLLSRRWRPVAWRVAIRMTRSHPKHWAFSTSRFPSWLSAFSQPPFPWWSASAGRAGKSGSSSSGWRTAPAYSPPPRCSVTRRGLMTGRRFSS